MSVLLDTVAYLLLAPALFGLSLLLGWWMTRPGAAWVSDLDAAGDLADEAETPDALPPAARAGEQR